jgi:hypothetical protein
MSATILQFKLKPAARNANAKSVHSSQTDTVFLQFPLTRNNTAGKKKRTDYLPPAA